MSTRLCVGQLRIPSSVIPKKGITNSTRQTGVHNCVVKLKGYFYDNSKTYTSTEMVFNVE